VQPHLVGEHAQGQRTLEVAVDQRAHPLDVTPAPKR
jgi:hypothetical protein